VIEGISVIIPAYNAAAWLEPTVGHIEVALREASIAPRDAEIIIVNDGSTDETPGAARALSCAYPINVVNQPNSGRFLARKAGLLASRKDNILFIDSRVFLHPSSLAFVRQQQAEDPSKVVWNGHVIVEKRGNVIARFGDAITFIGWRRYFAHPRTCSYGLEDFDHYPKGTTCFLAPKSILLSAAQEFERQTHDIKSSSDDTHLIRIIARDYRINLSPGFSCTYHARSRFSQFIQHSNHRGHVFVDGFLRPGNRFFIPLILFLVISALLLVGAVAAIIFYPLALLVALGAGVGVWLLEFVVALVLGVGAKDAASLFALTPLFAACYGIGIWQAVIRRAVKAR
jgi:glycosyltransferase involved in cell wall biosynthesis